MRIRTDKLKDIVEKYKSGILSFTPACSLRILKIQYEWMYEYVRMLELRAESEGIGL